MEGNTCHSFLYEHVIFQTFLTTEPTTTDLSIEKNNKKEFCSNVTRMTELPLMRDSFPRLWERKWNLVSYKFYKLKANWLFFFIQNIPNIPNVSYMHISNLVWSFQMEITCPCNKKHDMVSMAFHYLCYHDNIWCITMTTST